MELLAKILKPKSRERELNEITNLVRRAIVDAGYEQDKIIIIGQINIQINAAQGGGAKVEVSNS